MLLDGSLSLKLMLDSLSAALAVEQRGGDDACSAAVLSFPTLAVREPVWYGFLTWQV